MNAFDVNKLIILDGDPAVKRRRAQRTEHLQFDPGNW